MNPKFVNMISLNENGVNYTKKSISTVGENWHDGEAIKHIANSNDINKEVKDYNVDLPFPLLINEEVRFDEATNEIIKKYNIIQTDSKLSDLHRFVTYYNDDGVAERPSDGFDWLFYYRVGTILNIRTINDDLGNIIKLSKAMQGIKEACDDGNDLAAYGDFIQNIEVDTEEHKIKFIYRIGVHLKSMTAPIQTTDDDGNKLYNWKKFVWDENDKIGIKYEEEYNYEEEGDLDKLIKGEFTIQMENGIQSFSFNEYINGKYDKMLTTYKFEFITINNSFNYDKTIAHQNVNIVSTLTDLQIYRKDYDEFLNSPLIREEYLNGITYKPTKDIDVHIERGSTSAFEKHIAFGEVKTLDDMIDYKNGSFFILTEG